MADESRKNFHHKLGELKAGIVQLAAMVTEAIPRATQALLDMDLQQAQEIIDHDDVLDTLSLELEEQCLRLLALQQPMASDLRALMTAVKLNWELERSGDLTVNISKAIRRLYGTPFEPRIRGMLEQMSEHAYTLTKRAVDAYALGDAALAGALDDMDDALDALQAQYIHAIIETHDAGKLKLQPAVQLALIGRYYERIGDHAVNIGERTQYMITGWLPEHTGAARAEAKGRQGIGPAGEQV
jgi:phosphate transport system protein